MCRKLDTVAESLIYMHCDTEIGETTDGFGKESLLSLLSSLARDSRIFPSPVETGGKRVKS